MGRCTQRIITVFFVLVLSIICSRNAKGIPAFARKFTVSCSACHTTPPRLNETGYRFRAAGFRWPQAIGTRDKSEQFDILDYMGFRIQVSETNARSKIGSAEASKTNNLNVAAFELYPFIGSWGKYFSADTKITFGPSGAPAIENAYLKANVGDEKLFFGARLGIFHPYDGYGGSDSPATITRPLIQTTPANFKGSTFFTTWGFDQLGGEVGVDYRRTSVRAALLNGIVLSEQDDGTFKAFPAQGGALNPRFPAPTSNTPDFQLFVNHVLHPEGGGVSLYYYHGNLFLPIVGSTNTFAVDKFDRMAVYASYPVVKHLQLLGGFQRGRDQLATTETFASEGAFVEASVPIKKLSVSGFRYEWFDPSRERANNEMSRATAYVNAWFYKQLRIVAEYQHKNTKRGPDREQHDDSLQIRFIYIK
jgi:hypothetical protein